MKTGPNAINTNRSATTVERKMKIDFGRVGQILGSDVRMQQVDEAAVELTITGSPIPTLSPEAEQILNRLPQAEADLLADRMAETFMKLVIRSAIGE